MVHRAFYFKADLEVNHQAIVEVSQGDQMLLKAATRGPDLALLDVEMLGSDGLSAAEALDKSLPFCWTVILTTFGHSGAVHRAMESGALYLSDSTMRNLISTAIQKLNVHNRKEAAPLARERGWL